MKWRFRFPSFNRAIDWWLYLLPILLVGIGITTIVSLTYGTSRTSLAESQGVYAAIGLVLMLFFTRLDYRMLRGAAYHLYSGIVILLFLVDRFGVVIFGARRWLDLQFFQLQPSELAKIGIVILLARFFADHEELTPRDYGWLIFLIGLPLFLVLKQPDLGTAMLIFMTSVGLIIAGGVPRKILFSFFGIGLLSLPILWGMLAEYQKQRVVTFLNPAADPYGAGYNVLQALIAVGSGGVYGQGLGQGSQSQLQFLPVAHTDFIFSGVAEATGLLGSITLLVLFSFLLFRIIRVAQVAKDRFGMLIGVGFAVLFFAEMFVNIGMNLAIMPVTGVPLPFVSHGGTALIANFIAIGILQSIVYRQKRMTF